MRNIIILSIKTIIIIIIVIIIIIIIVIIIIIIIIIVQILNSTFQDLESNILDAEPIVGHGIGAALLLAQKKG